MRNLLHLDRMRIGISRRTRSAGLTETIPTRRTVSMARASPKVKADTTALTMLPRAPRIDTQTRLEDQADSLTARTTATMDGRRPRRRTARTPSRQWSLGMVSTAVMSSFQRMTLCEKAGDQVCIVALPTHLHHMRNKQILTSSTWFHCLQNPVHAVTLNELTFPRNTLFCSFVSFFFISPFPQWGIGFIYACIRCHRESWPVHFPGNASHALRRFLSSCLEFSVFQMVRPGSVSDASHLSYASNFFFSFFSVLVLYKREKILTCCQWETNQNFRKSVPFLALILPGLHCLS
jgi:hypothetical protein